MSYNDSSLGIYEFDAFWTLEILYWERGAGAEQKAKFIKALVSGVFLYRMIF